VPQEPSSAVESGEAVGVVGPLCPSCRSADPAHVRKDGRRGRGVQRYRCTNPACTRKHFTAKSSSPFKYLRSNDEDILLASYRVNVEGASISATAREFGVSHDTVRRWAEQARRRPELKAASIDLGRQVVEKRRWTKDLLHVAYAFGAVGHTELRALLAAVDRRMTDAELDRLDRITAFFAAIREAHEVRRIASEYLKNSIGIPLPEWDE
jgi:transposase-like protein